MGFSTDEEAATAEGWLARIHPDDRARVAATSADAAKNRIPINMEYRVVHHDNSVHHVLGTGMVTYNNEGKPVASTGLVIDIDERKSAEEALRESEARLAAFLEQLPVGIGLSDMQGRWLLTNPTMARFGLTEFIPSRERDGMKHWRTWDEAGKLVAPADWPGAKGLRGERVLGADFLYTADDGEETWTRISSVPFLSADGEVTGAINIIQDINAHKLAERALRQSEERLRITMQSVSDYAIITTNAQNKITGWSGGAESIFGYTAAEAIGQSYKLIFTPEDIEAGIPDEELQQADEQGRASDERWHMRKDGSRFFMTGVVTPIRSGTHSGYVKIAQDMTEQKGAEEALRITEERYRIALQSANMGAWDWDLINDTTLWNPQHYTLLGVDVPAVEQPKPSAYFVQFVHPDDVAAVTGALREAIEETGLYRMDAFRIIRLDGQVRWMSGYGKTVAYIEGKASRMVGVMYEITARIETNIALRDRQLKLEIAQRAARMGIWGYDLVKNQGIATPELIELTGYPNASDTWELEVFLKLVYADDRPLVVAAYKNAADNKAGIELEFRLYSPEGNILWMLMRGSYIPPYDQMNATLMGSIIDITERKLLEQQKDEFIGIASHELKTPVTSIKAYAEVLQEIFEDAKDNYSAGLMGKLDAQVDRLNGLIHSLLDTTRISEGELKLEIEHFDLNELIIARAEELQRTAKNHKLVVMPGVATPVMADLERISQVLTNLIANAIKYSPAGGDVIIAIARAGDGIQVSVRDNGIGISAEIQDNIFERFYRVNSAQINTFPGLGLGLYIAAQIIRRHGGTIGVESVPGEGSVFYFTLPLDGIQI